MRANSAPLLPEPVSKATRHLLSTLYKEPGLWGEVRITDAEIPDPTGAVVFRALRNLRDKGLGADAATLGAECKRLGEDVQLWQWTAERADAANLREYQRILSDYADRRRLSMLVEALSLKEVRGEIAEAWALVHQAVARPESAAPQESMADLLAQVLDEIEKPQPTVGLGLPTLDGLLDGGLRPGEVFILAARPSVGKSAMALQVIIRCAAREVPVGLWTLEMSKAQWVRRALAHRSKVNSKRLRTGTLQPDDYGRLGNAVAAMKAMYVHFADTENTTPDGFRLNAARLVREKGCKLLVVDYLQLMQPARGAYSREHEVSTLSRTVKLTAIDLGVPVIMLAQLNRAADDRVPSLANLRESGAVEQDADEVFFLHREKDPDTNLLKPDTLGILAKNRDGETGAFPLHFDGEHYRFDETIPEVA